MDINIGLNTLRNTNGVFTAHGQELIRLEVGESDGQLLLTMAMYMPTGSEVAKLERNAWVSNEGDRFEITVEPHSVKVMDKTLKNVVIQLATDGTKRIEVPLAKFYTSKGMLSEVSAEWWRVGNKMELTGIDMDLEGGNIELPD
ncbi:MAG: hypothetical protein JSU59_01620 [Nitrospirota bacterium]|nr:MAG: hypothetical protein JSU59_01620 [Nitrospirota bacterium]